MSKRERILVWVVALVVGFFVLDRLAITPVQSRLSQLKADTDTIEQRINEDMVLIDNHDLIESRWDARLAAGLDHDPASARLRVQRHFSDFAESVGMTLNNLSAGGNINGGPFTEIRFSLTGTGELDSVVRFLKHVQESSAPLAVLTCDLSRRDEGSGLLTLRLTVSTLVLSDKEPPS